MDAAFWWVYDCGTERRWQKQLEREVDRFRANMQQISGTHSNLPKLDLLALSHFDTDHVSGLLHLLKNFRVEVLLLPYVPLWQRVASLVSSSAFHNDATRAFFCDPVGYLRSIDGASIDRIVLVPPSIGEAGNDNTDEDVPIPNPESPNNPRMILTRISPDDSDQAGTGAPSSDIGGGAEWLQPGGRILTRFEWEFVPYNDPRNHPKSTPNFRLRVKRLSSLLIQGTTATRTRALRRLCKTPH